MSKVCRIQGYYLVGALWHAQILSSFKMFNSLTHIRLDASFTIEQSLSHAFVVFNLDPIRTTTTKKKVVCQALYPSSSTTIQKLHREVIQKTLMLERGSLPGDREQQQGAVGDNKDQAAAASVSLSHLGCTGSFVLLPPQAQGTCDPSSQKPSRARCCLLKGLASSSSLRRL